MAAGVLGAGIGELLPLVVWGVAASVIVAGALVEERPDTACDAGAWSATELQRVNSELGALQAACAAVAWRLGESQDTSAASNTTADAKADSFTDAWQRRAAALAATRARWSRRWCGAGSTPSCAPRAQRLLCRGPRYTPAEARRVGELLGALSRVHASARLVDESGRAWRGEPDLERLMRDAGADAQRRRWAWEGWRAAAGPPARDLYAALVPLLNAGARRAGYSDVGALWRAELEVDDLRGVAQQLFARVQPLYELLHAVVRAKLPHRFPGCCRPLAPLPAHLVGDMWSQDWSGLASLLIPNAPDLGGAMRARGWSVRGMAARAEDVYASMGLPPLPPAFWKRSQGLDGPPPPGTPCHGTAANMFHRGDVRIRLCAQVDENDFYAVLHELGHIQYYMAYEDQPVVFQDGANSAFHEAVGDAVALGAWTPQHLLRLGLVDDAHPPQELEHALLVRQALAKLPQLAFALTLDEWRWSAFEGSAPPSAYNDAWWALRRRLQGVCPPAPRPDRLAFFDPAAKFHVPDNTPYIRYFLSGFLQVQIFKALCELAVHGKVGHSPLPFPLHQCDIYGSLKAGQKLREMMSYGSSRHWSHALFVLTGTQEISADPLLEYFEPLIPWLKHEVLISNATVGWDASEC